MTSIGAVGNGFGRKGAALYLQLAQVLRQQVESGQYKPGDCLPTERQIAKEFGVSLITVRAACRLLVDEGLISRQSGKGTFVAQKPELITYEASTSLADLYAYGGDVERLAGGQSHETRRECLVRRTLPADTRTAELLHLPARTKVLECKVRLSVNQVPLGLILSVVPLPLGLQVSKKMLEEKSLIQVLSETCRVRVVEGDQWISASRAKRRTAEVLDMRAGDPVLIIQRVFYGADEIPTHLSTVIYCGDRFRQHVRMHSSMSWKCPPSMRRTRELGGTSPSVRPPAPRFKPVS